MAALEKKIRTEIVTHLLIHKTLLKPFKMRNISNECLT